MYYVISLSHTHKTDSYLTLWRPDNAGYCWSLQNAGVYEHPKEGYHDSEFNMPIKTDILERLTIDVSIERNDKIVAIVPNCKAVWDSLGIYCKRGELIRKKEVQSKAKISKEKES